MRDIQTITRRAAQGVAGNKFYSHKQWFNWLINWAQQEAIERDKTITELLCDFYNGVQRDNLDELLKEYFPMSYDEMQYQLEFINITKMFVDQTAIIYKSGAIRKLTTDSEKEQELWQWIFDNSKYDRVLRDVNKKVNLTENAIVRVWFDGWRIRLNVLTRDYLDVLTPDNDPFTAEALYYSQKPYYSDSDRDLTYYYWDKDTYKEFNSDAAFQNEDNPDDVNPYGLIPFVRFTRRLPDDNYFVIPPEDLAVTQEQVNVVLTELNNMLKFQAHATPVMIVPEGSLDVKIGNNPALPIVIPISSREEQQSDFRYETPNADFDAIQKEISNKIRRFAQTRGFSAEDFTVSGDKASGLSMQISNKAMINMLKNEIPFYEDSEQELFEVIRRVWNYRQSELPSNHPMKGRVFSEKTELRVQIKEPKTVENTMDIIDRHSFLLDRGLESVIEFYQETYNMTEQEAIKYYEKVLENRNNYPVITGLSPAQSIEELEDFDTE